MSARISPSLLLLFNLLGLLLVIVVNGLANALPLNGWNTGELSALYPNLFVPAGVTFAIWGLIYVALILFVGRQFYARTNDKREEEAVTQAIGWWFFATCLFNAGWIFAWHYRQVGLSVLIMLALLTSLIVIYQRIKVLPSPARWATHWPFSLYLGWITVATIANITAFLVDRQWQAGFSQAVWAAIMIGVAVAVGLIILNRERDYIFNFVLLWALAGILIKRTNTFPPAELVTTAATLGMLALIGSLSYAWWRDSRRLVR